MDDAVAGGSAMLDGDLRYDKLAHSLAEDNIKHAVLVASTNAMKGPEETTGTRRAVFCGTNIVRHREGAMGAPALGIFTRTQRLSEGHCLAWKHSIVLPEGPSMRRRNERTHPRQIAGGHHPRRWAAMNTDTDRESAPVRETRRRGASRASPAAADAALEFGRFRVLLRRRQLLDDEVPVELGTRAFDLLLVLLGADGLLVSKEELLSRVWPGVVVSKENLKVQISALRKVLGAERDVIRTEFGRGYRFTGVLRSASVPDAYCCSTPAGPRPGQTLFSQNCLPALRRSFVVAEPRN
jgi:DNA-binding winged helix-turn-helix (wHTH) protein